MYLWRSRVLALLAVAGAVVPCAAAGGSTVIRIGVDSQSIGRWVKAGDPVAKLHGLYPKARFRTYVRGVAPVRGWWLVVRTSRVPDFHQLTALLAKMQAGHVTELVVNVHAEGD